MALLVQEITPILMKFYNPFIFNPCNISEAHPSFTPQYTVSSGAIFRGNKITIKIKIKNINCNLSTFVGTK